MNAADIRLAETVYGLLGNDARKVASDELASRVRTTGWEATLRWLSVGGVAHDHRLALARTLCEVLDTPLATAERNRRSNLELLSDSRRALALAEALHLIARIHTPPA